MNKLLLLLLLSVSWLPNAQAQVLVLIHGYASNATVWEQSGITGVLSNNGWRRGGMPGVDPAGGNTFYTVDLPAAAPLFVQTKYLLDFLRLVRQRHVNETLTLVGHSAGGVVARLSLLGGNITGVSRLITIASPHLGTPRAVQGLNVANEKPFFCPGPGYYFVKSLVGGSEYRYLRDSRGALQNLLPPGYGNLLQWANQQPHPDIHYHAVVRQQGDELVPAFSQDLNQIPALQGKARVWLSQARHSLNPQDGELLLLILSAPGA